MADPFVTTRWSQVVTAAAPEAPGSSDALSALCEAYWYPLYAYIRRRGSDEDEAQDLTQGFFSYLIEKGVLAAADRERGRFRAFLLTAFKRYAARQHARERALKRGGGQVKIGLDFARGEERYRLEPAHDMTPERLYQRRWALSVLERVLAALEEQARAKGQSELFDAIRGCLTGPSADRPYAAIAAELGLSEGALKVKVHRLRRSYRSRLLAEIRETLADPVDTDRELAELMAALAT